MTTTQAGIPATYEDELALIYQAALLVHQGYSESVADAISTVKCSMEHVDFLKLTCSGQAGRRVNEVLEAMRR